MTSTLLPIRARIVCQKTPFLAVSSMACRHAKVWKLPKTGNIGNLTLVEQPVPAPSAGAVSIAVKAVRVPSSLTKLHMMSAASELLDITRHSC